MFFGLHPRTGTLYFTPDFWYFSVAASQFLLVPQRWSLGVELTFYLLAPLIVRRSAGTIALIAAMSIMLRVIICCG